MNPYLTQVVNYTGKKINGRRVANGDHKLTWAIFLLSCGSPGGELKTIS